MQDEPFLSLLARYLSFVWLFEPVPARAPLLQRAAIVRRNRDRGLRYLPVYMRRYAGILLACAAAGIGFEMLSAPLVCGALLTCSSLAAVALVVSAVGFCAIRLRLYDHGRF
ncbi:MAG TPA: hypothetical protein VM491_15805 [Burkholderiaceae bacterium]|nr:hypothetical protein [Burkholderiaceae bacterium]